MDDGSEDEVRSERLPVVDNLTRVALVGSISKADIMLYLAGKQTAQKKPESGTRPGIRSGDTGL
jgi:hypothetical protein